MKRFWTQASVARAPDGGFTILLDGKPMRLPGGETLRIGQAPLAAAIAAEWDAPAPGAEVTPDLLPLTQLAATATLRIAPAPADTAAAIARYGRADLLCYRAEEPAALVQRQQAEWQPWLDWAAQQHDAPLMVTRGIAFIEQSPQALAALARAVAAHDVHGLAALGVIVPVLGSLILGLAVTAGALEAEEAFRLSALDALFQEAHWGQDAGAVAERARAAEDVRGAARYLRLTREFA